MKKYAPFILFCIFGFGLSIGFIDGLPSASEDVQLTPYSVDSASSKIEKNLAENTPLRVIEHAPRTSLLKDVRVVLVSVDGFRTDLVTYMPSFQSMLREGSWTLRATTTIPSITTTAHASMFTGQPPEVHGVTHGAPRDVSIKLWKPLRTETIFHSLNSEHYKLTAFVQKEKLLRLLPEHLLVRTVLDSATRESKIVKNVCDEVLNPDGSHMLIVHLKRFDAVGHHDGWMSKKQIASAMHVDDALHKISTCISQAKESQKTKFALIVTADHGGSGKNHDSRKGSDMHIPWLIIGPGVKKNHEIRRAIQVMDTAAVMRYFLGYRDAVHKGIRARFPMEILRH